MSKSFNLTVFITAMVKGEIKRMLWLEKINAGFINGRPDNNNTNNLLIQVFSICNAVDFLKYIFYVQNQNNSFKYEK